MVSILETAILAMDTYNRLGAGLNLGTQPIGTFSLVSRMGQKTKGATM